MCTLKEKMPTAGDKVLFPSHPNPYLLMKEVRMATMDQQAFSQMKQDHSSELLLMCQMVVLVPLQPCGTPEALT
jgi:hypothetical protein